MLKVMKLTLDEYGEVINSNDTYEAIATILLGFTPVLIGWTDENSSHHDILFCYKAAAYQANEKSFQGGIKSDYLFVSVIRVGSFGFSIGSEQISPHYISGKLGVGNDGNDVTSVQLAELINGVIHEIRDPRTD